jgi:hypothetical protein
MDEGSASMEWVKRASEYRTLRGKRDELGYPLGPVEAARLAELEHFFQPDTELERASFEGREQARIPVSVLVEFDRPSALGGIGGGQTRDLSATGVFIETPVPLPVGARTILKVRNDAEGAEWRFTAEVVRVRGGDKHGMGLRFVGIPLSLRVGHRRVLRPTRTPRPLAA